MVVGEVRLRVGRQAGSPVSEEGDEDVLQEGDEKEARAHPHPDVRCFEVWRLKGKAEAVEVPQIELDTSRGLASLKGGGGGGELIVISCDLPEI